MTRKKQHKLEKQKIDCRANDGLEWEINKRTTQELNWIKSPLFDSNFFISRFILVMGMLVGVARGWSVLWVQKYIFFN